MSKASTLAGFTSSVVPTNNLNVGVVTAVRFYGDGAGLTGVGIGSTGSINTTGIITASKFVGSGIGITNIGGTLDPIIYNPGIGATSVGLTTNIVITFNKPILAVGNTITLRTGSASGTIVESFDVLTSSKLSISGGVLTIDPTSTLGAGTTHFVVVPAGAYKDILNTATNTGITTYSFVTGPVEYYLFAWGSGASGQLGQSNTTPYSSPVQIPGTSWSSISSDGSQHSLASKTDGTLYAWGSNTVGQLAQNNTTQYSSPVQIPGTQWGSIGGGSVHSLATKTDGTLWSWGHNAFGQLGQNNRTQYSSPVQIPGTSWSSISGGGQHSLATKTDGTLWTWGDNAGGGLGAGQLGQNNLTQYSSPVQIPGTQWSSVECSDFYMSIATKTDGTLWVWGSNWNGQLGTSQSYASLGGRSSPVQIPGTQWNLISAGRGHTLSTKTDGTLWAWGGNSNGQLGQNNTTVYSSPIQIPGTQWNYIFSANSNFSVASKTDGTLWSWGYNGSGRLGQNNTTQYSSPVQIQGTTWSSINGGSGHSLAIKS